MCFSPCWHIYVLVIPLLEASSEQLDTPASVATKVVKVNRSMMVISLGVQKDSDSKSNTASRTRWTSGHVGVVAKTKQT